MTRTNSQGFSFVQSIIILVAVGSALLTFATSATFAQPPTTLLWDTELTSLNLTGGPVPLPLSSDPGNTRPGSVEGYGVVNSDVVLTLSSQRLVSPGPASLGQSCAFSGGIATAGASGQCGGSGDPEPIDPAEHDGDTFFVQSFFDVFFDVTVIDVDARPGHDYVGGLPAITLQDIGPADMQNFYTAVFDADAPNFGLLPPPESSPYIGHFNIEIDLSAYFGMLVDINGNGIGDKIKFTLAAHQVDGENRTFLVLPDGTVVDTFDSTASLEGAVVDITSDPPFGPFELSGPSSAESLLLNPVVPEPAAIGLLFVGGLILPTLSRTRRTRR